MATKDDNLISLLRKNKLSISELSIRLKITQKQVKEIVKDLKLKGVMITQSNGKWFITDKPKNSKQFSYESRDDNSYYFGFIGDTHLCSKYERLDVLNDLYDIFELEGVDRVFHGGNWVEGEASFNVHELKVHGIDDQIDYLVEHYPKKEFKTYSVWGDDHEGWWGKKNGIDVGVHCENVFRNNEREDWINVGFMESFIELKNKNSGKTNQLLLIHAGGGSAYATSYRPQKIVESFTGGSKPGILLIGHYHKLSYNIIRNVHTVQVGCTQDQTSFMRKKGIDAHLGGGIIKLKQDPRTGALYNCRVEFYHYYSKGYYNNRFNYKGLLNLPELAID